MADLNFEGLARLLLSQSRDILFAWLPGGKLVGHEYCCGSLRGQPGTSMKVNINTGKWADFASNDKGGDLVSLYAAIKGKKQGEAFKELSSEYQFEQNGNGATAVEIVKEVSDVCQPPLDQDFSKPLELFKHRDHGKPSAVWFYKNHQNEVLFAVARYDGQTKGKHILPWTWSSRGFWNCKGWPAPRPLFGLELLDARPDWPVIIVEGEKAAMAVRALCGHSYVVMTWPNGAKAFNKADWSPIYGRKVLIWPDADPAGIEAAKAIADLLYPFCPEIKIAEVEHAD